MKKRTSDLVRLELVIPIAIAKDQATNDFVLVLGSTPLDYDLVLPIDVDTEEEASEMCDEIAEKLGNYIHRVLMLSLGRENFGGSANDTSVPPSQVVH